MYKHIITIILLLLPLLAMPQSHKSNQLYKKGEKLFDAEKYEEAVPYFQKSDSLDKTQLEPTSENYYRAELKMADCWHNIASDKEDEGKYSEAIKLETLALEIRRRVLGEEHTDYASSLHCLALYNDDMGNYTEAIRLGIIATEIRKKVLGEEHIDYAKSINNLAGTNSHIGNYTEAIRLGTIAMEVFKTVFDEEHPYYAGSLGNLAEYNSDLGNYQESIRLSTRTMEIYKKVLGEEHPDYARSLNNLAEYNSCLGNCQEAIRLGTQAMEIRKKVLGEEHPDYACSLNNLAKYNSYLGNYQEAIRLSTRAMEINKKVLGEEHPGYAWSLHNLAEYNSYLGNYQEAIRLSTRTMEIYKKILGEEHPNYALSLNSLALSNSEIGNDQEAIRLGTQAMEIRKKVLGEEHPDYASSLANLAIYYDDLGDYQEAIRLGTKAMEIRKKVLGEEHPYYAGSLGNLAGYNSDLGNYQEAIRLDTKAMEIYKKVLGEEHPDYARSLHNLAVDNDLLGNYQEAIKLCTEAMEINKKVFGEEHPVYAGTLTNLAVSNSYFGNYQEAIRLVTEAMEIYKKALGEEHPYYAMSLRNLADGYLGADNYNYAVWYYKQGYERTSSFILKNFSWMTNKERSNYWKKFSDFYDTDLPYAAYKIADNADVTALAYNGLVFSKGLLLNAELEIQKLIEQSHDTTFANRYYKIRQDRAKLDELYQLSPDERPMDADSLLKAIDNEERLLVQSSKELGDYTKNLSIDWHDIQKSLKDNDLAVEFANFQDTAIKQQIYVAFVLKQGMTSPELVKLFETDDFYGIKTNDYYKTPKLYNLVWKPLTKYLDGVKNVYFSPTGQFHTIGIEYLPDEDGKVFAEKFDVYRLSSTRELALENTINPNKKAATYGGIRYDADSDSTDVKRSVGAVYLDGTKVESAAVAELLRTAQYSVTALSDTSATEESFKKLSGNNLKILHIGTHGFYMSEADMENAGYKFYTSSKQSDEDKAMSCSGLLFAGANAAIDLKNRSVIPEGDDGVLTAKEISRLDFSGLDLVVLSACQTGLGEVTGEGVFGLQRGFKKAGAQTIIMSLWKVFDDSTQLLITEFFKNLTAGQSKRAAFLAAQKTVREKYPNPLCWAAFIMVDGMD